LPISRLINSAQRDRSAVSMAVATWCRIFARLLASSCFQSFCAALTASITAASWPASGSPTTPTFSSVAGSIVSYTGPAADR